MRSWLLMFSGPLIWSVHFAGVYAIASVAALMTHPDGAAARAAVGILTAACLAALALVLARVARRPQPTDEVDGLVHLSAQVGAGFSIVAVLWQGLPAIIR